MNIALTQANLDQALRNPWFGIYNRCALDIALAQGLIPVGFAKVYFDIDGLKQANDRWGKVESSRRIKHALCRTTDYTFSAFSGDEILTFCPTHDAVGYAHRIQSDLCSMGLSATFAISLGGHTPDELEEEVSRAKDLGHRGTITVL